MTFANGLVEQGGEKMRKFVLVSHGSLAQGVKNSVEMISGKQDNLYAFCMQEGEGPAILKEKISNFLEQNKKGEIVFVSDFPGGSVNTMLMNFLDCDNVFLVSGMNSMLVLNLLLSQAKIDVCLDKAIEAGKATIKRIEIVEEDQEDDFFD